MLFSNVRYETFSRCSKEWKWSNTRSGQAMLEYVLVFAALLALMGIFALTMYAIQSHSNRSVALVSSEYP